MARRHWPPYETRRALDEGTLPAFIGKDAVCALTGWTGAMLELRCRTGKFPEPIATEKSLKWKTSQVAAWLQRHQDIRPLELFFRRPRTTSAADRRV
jgi:predicted DNA-binding transcriptional regulator AlpA